MKKTKWLAVGVLVLLVAGAVNSIFGVIEAPSIPGDNAMKGGESSSASPFMEAGQDNPMKKNLPEADGSGLLAVIEAVYEIGESAPIPDDMPQLIQAYQTLNREKYSENPWYLFFEGVGHLTLKDSQSFEAISDRLFSMETVTSDLLSCMGNFLDAYGYHDYAWMYFERAIRQYVLEGSSMDENQGFIYNPFFFPIRSLGMLITSGKSQVAMQRLNVLVKMNPKIENMYWFYLETARYYESQGMAELSALFKKLAARQFQDAISFNPRIIVNGDYYLTAMALVIFMFLVYIVALRFKYHGAARHARRQACDARKDARGRFFSWRHSPYHYLRPREFVFLLAMAALFLVFSSNARSIMLSIGRAASTPNTFASGRYGLPESKQALANLKADYGDTPEFKRFYAYCLAQTGDYGAARNILEPSLEENRDDVAALVNLAVIEYREGNGTRAVRLIGRAVELAPTNLEVVYNYRVITGQMKEFPEWFERLKASEDLETTARIVSDSFDAILPNAMAVISGGTSDTLLMSDRGHFLRLWTEQPLKLRSRMLGALEALGLTVSKNPVGYLGKAASKWIWIVSFMVVGYFCVVFIKGAGTFEDRSVSRCPACGKILGGASGNDVSAGSFVGRGGDLLCSECAGNARYDDEGFLVPKSRRSQVRWFPFVGAFREGRLVTATLFLMVFLYCLVSFVFANSSILGVYGATGYLSSIAIWRGTFLSLPVSLSMHNAATYASILLAGMAASIFLSLAAARRPRPSGKKRRYSEADTSNTFP